MSRNRILFALLSLALVALAACAPADEGRVAALEERLDSLEKQVQTLQQGGGGAALEAEAQTALTAVNQLVAAGKVDEAKAKLAGYGTKYASTKSGRSFQSLTRELAVIGKDCPSDWGIEKWFQGKDKIDLSAKAPTVVVFWESWCPHCRREVPKLQAMYERFNGKGLQMIGLTRINRSATEEAVTDIISQNNVKYPIAKENGAAAQYFAVSGIPAAAVLKDGKVVWRGHPARISDEMIQNWLSS